MIKLLIATVFCLYASISFCHQDQYVVLREKNVTVRLLIGWKQHEISSHGKILTHLVAELSKKKSFSEEVYINFVHDYIQWGSSYCALSVGQFKFPEYDEKLKAVSTTRGNGIVLDINDHVLKIKSILQLISSAIDSYSAIEKAQKEWVIDKGYILNGKRQYDTLNTVPDQMIQTFLKRNDVVVQDVVSEKTYRNPGKKESYPNTDYYYQNGQFHFYSTAKPNNSSSRKDEDDRKAKAGETYLVVDSILEIVYSYGDFVFVNDSVFYYIPRTKNISFGPFKIDSLKKGRSPVFKMEYELRPMTRITIFFREFYFGVYQKALFIPDSNLLISNYHLEEHDLIHDLIEKKRGNDRKPQAKSNFAWLFWSIMGFMLIGVFWIFAFKM